MTKITPQAAPKISNAFLEEHYGFALAFMNSNPELKQKFQEAVAGGWPPEKFVAELRGTTWFKAHSSNVRNAILQMTGDPATWKANVATMSANVTKQWNELYGSSTLDPKYIQRLATQAQMMGWSSEQLLQHMASSVNYRNLMNSAKIGGTAAENLGHVQQLLGQYGVSMTRNTVDGLVQQIISNQTNLGAVQNKIKELAKSTYSAYASQLDAGQTMQDIASPYITKMADLLETSPNGIGVRDHLVQKALTATDPKTGHPAPMNIADFANQVRQDTRWQYTNNARQEAASTLRTLGQAWGLSS